MPKPRYSECLQTTICSPDRTLSPGAKSVVVRKYKWGWDSCFEFDSYEKALDALTREGFKQTALPDDAPYRAVALFECDTTEYPDRYPYLWLITNEASQGYFTVVDNIVDDDDE